MLIFNKKNTLKRILRYVFFVTLILWLLTTIYVIYQYLWASSKQTITKGGTFVEGIFDTTSFLPYLSNDYQSKFYQGLLFRKCLDFDLNENGRPEYQDDLCHITTRDYKTYYASIASGNIWSDGVPITIDDVFFTYNEILKLNKLEIPYLESYQDINVEMDVDKVKVEFENSSEDNTLFFTNYILPKHALIEPNLDMYQQNFAIEPVYNNCAKIKSQSTDQYSLIFDLSNCEDTNLGFYQIKNALSFDDFKKGIDSGNGSIIDAYIGHETLNGYRNINTESNKLVSMFFNTNSDKMTVRLRRSLGGFINYNFFEGDDNEYMKKYDKDLFNYYLSTGKNIKDFLTRVDMNQGLSKQDLIDGGVKIMANNIKFTSKEKVFVFYTEEALSDFNLDMSFDSDYDKISIQVGSGELVEQKQYDKKKKTLKYKIDNNSNLEQGLNKYTIYGRNKDKKQQIGSINIYNLYNEEAEKENLETLKIIYFDNDLSNYTIGKLKKIFKEFKIGDNFEYDKVSDVNELEGKLTAGDYDIVLNTIDMGLSTDISKLFSTELATVNPSQYINARLLSLLKQYNESKNKGKITSEINTLYANDMPIVILGNEYTKLKVKEELLNKINIEELNLYEYNRRTEFYKNLSLTENIYIDKNKAKDLKNFWKFIIDPKNY